MGRRHSIVNKKMETAASKGKLYAKMGRVIEIHARSGADIATNSVLAQAVHKARQNGVPREVIEKAIKKGSGQLDGNNYIEQYYEGYGPGACAIYIKTLTDNTNRTSTAVRVILQKYGGIWGEPGSVAWQFQQVGVIKVDGLLRSEKKGAKQEEKIIAFDEETLEMDALEAGAQDIDIEDGRAIITTTRQDYSSVDQALVAKGYKISASDVEAIAETTMALTKEDQRQLEILIEQLEEDDDVEKVWTNVA